MAYSIVFNTINVNTLDTNATVAVGQKAQSGWNSHAKNNFGNGMLFGINYTTASVNNIVDNDVFDTPINDADAVASPQSQAL